MDTSVLVRFLTGDDEVQYRTGRKLFSSESVFLPDTVVLETEWVLRAAYGLDFIRRTAGLGECRVECP